MEHKYARYGPFQKSWNFADRFPLSYCTDTYKFEQSSVSIHYDFAQIASISAVDLNQDGKLDFLVQSHPYVMSTQTASVNTSITQIMAYFGDYAGIVDEIMLPEAYSSQVSIFSYSGTLFPDLIGNRVVNGELVSSVWINGNAGRTWTPAVFAGGKPLSNPHSVASVDFDGDCVADLFIDRADGTSEIWLLNQVTGKFEYRQTFSAVPGRGQATFSDFDGDGAVDIAFPVCFPSTTCAQTNEIRVFYNAQQPVCSGLFSSSKNCRKTTSLCTSDPHFSFADFSTSASESKVVIVSSSAFPSATRLFSLPSATNSSERSVSEPMTIRAGDYNVDRFTDLLVPLLPASNNIAQMTLWESVACTHEACGTPATSAKRRTFHFVAGESSSALSSLPGAFSASWFDLDESGSLDILVNMETTNSLQQRVHSVAAITNNYFNDGYFIKTLGLNGLCTVNCGIKQIKLGNKPYGVNQHGAAWKYTLADLSGKQLVNAVPQLSQSAYGALQTPYALSGLGRPSNYIDYVYMGVPLYLTGHQAYQSWSGIIPNSQVVVTPYPKNSPSNWAIELYISPSGALLWIALGVILCLIVSGALIVFFQWRERKADEAEKKEREHLFSFNAM